MAYFSRKLLGFLLLILLISHYSFSDDTHLKDTLVHGPTIPEDYFLFNGVLNYYVDTSHQYKDQEILNGAADRFFHHRGGYTTRIEIPEATYWTRFRMIPALPEQPKVLEIMTPQTQLIWVYFPIGNNQWRQYHTGNLLPWDQRAFRHKNFIFNIPADLDSKRDVFIKVYSSNQVHLLFKIRAVEDFSSYSLSEYLYLGLFYGMVIFLVLYNLLFFISTRSWVYLFYCLSVIAAAANTLANDGLGFAFVWPEHPEWSQPLGYIVFPLSFTMFYLLYGYFFLSGADEYLKKIRRIILITIVLYLTYYLCRIAFFSTIKGFDWLYAIPFTVVYVLYVILYFKGFTFARFFIIGSSFVLIAIIVDQLRLHNFIEGGIYTVYSFNIGVLLDSLSLSLALVDRLSYFKRKEVEAGKKEIVYLKEISELQNKVNRELEGKVNERTLELQQEKGKLESIVNQLEMMSIELDKDNWKLKRNIKEEKEARMNAVEISFEEFLQLYPTPAFCLDRLQEWKWGNAFFCKKCGYDKFSERDDKARKCSKCGTIESITANTLFHGLKFPLHLAFYITYRVIQNENCKVEDLSRKTGVSIPSCRNYKKHILEYRNNLLVNKKIKSVHSWIQLVEEKTPDKE